ncbi:hypothetical protein Dda_0818 [Drechslerella dactyloides]|uniref:SEC7 domain-containing protein n=1 Tax=Drechslerella dactyloides TaxID=74499 RepID=A0AAD6NMZ5_DREDA|nr:hypothetical protein Dda_0818 [Drechslerella dactyloides]
MPERCESPRTGDTVTPVTYNSTAADSMPRERKFSQDAFRNCLEDVGTLGWLAVPVRPFLPRQLSTQMDFSTSTTSLHHHHIHHHHYSASPASSRSRAASTHKQQHQPTPLQIHRSASASALVAGGSSSRGGSSVGASAAIGSDPRSKKSTAAAPAGPPPVPTIPSFLKKSNVYGNGFYNPSGVTSTSSFAGSRPGSAKLTIDTSLSNGYLKQNRSVSDNAYPITNSLAQASSTSNRKVFAASNGNLSNARGARLRRDLDRHEVFAPADTGFRDSLVDNLLLDFDKLGQDFSNDPVFDKFLDPFYLDNEHAQDDQGDIAYRDLEYARGRLHSRQSTSKRSDSNTVAPQRTFDNQQNPKEANLPEDDELFEHNGTLVYTADGRFITTPPQSRRGPPPSRQQSHTFDSYSDAAPAPKVSNRSRAREPETPRQPTQLHRRRSTRSNKSLKRVTDVMADHSTLPTIPSEMQSTDSTSSPPAKQASKPGFFRRVFGGGAANAKPTLQIPPTATSSSGIDGDKPMDGVKRQASVSVNPISASPDQVPPKTPQMVTKKPSGFFRRRKRSVSEHDPVPPLRTNNITHSSEIDNNPASPSTARQETNHQGVSSRPETSMSRSHSRAHRSNHEREMSEASITPIGAVSSSSGQDVVAARPRRATNRSIESELPNRITEVKEVEIATEKKITAAANINIDEIVASSTTTKNMYTPPPKSEMPPIPNPKPDVSQPEEAKQFEGSFLRDDDSDSGHDINAANTGPEIVSGPDASPDTAPGESKKEEDKSHSLDTERSDSASDVFYDAASKEKSFVDDAKSEAKSEAASMPVVVLPQAEDDEAPPPEDANATPRPQKTAPVIDEDFDGPPSPEEIDAARKIYEGDEEFMPKGKAAAFLGEAGAPSARIRTAYMSMFDWTGVNILVAFRGLCEKLVLKGETQQVDRIVSAVAKQWCDCNVNHGFKNVDVVHTIVYSILLVNTDLHMADLHSSQRMTKGQFVKNTLATIKRGLSIDEGEHPQNVARCQTPYDLDDPDDAHHGNLGSSGMLTKRLSFIRGPGAVQRFFEDQSSENFANSIDSNGTGGESGGPLINAPCVGNNKQWDLTLESILKDFYLSIRSVALPLHGATSDKSPDSITGTTTLGKELRRTNSTVSKAPSESSMSMRLDRHAGSFGSSNGNSSTTRLGSKWKNNRSRPRLYPGSFAGSSRTSLDDRLWSPSASSTWSKYSLDKTATTMMSTDSLGSGFGQGDYMQSIGFANALSTAIIREETGTSGLGSDDGEQSIQPTILDDDVDELALYGAPWAKEGMIKHKHHLEAADKRAKNRGWVECFAVVEKGWMRLFLFSSEKRKNANNVVGGGNWMENAEPIGSFMLRQTLASALPPPGYSRSRPHVFALSLPNGAVHLFQCGTAELIKEWVGTANYWSARLSKEPLVGAVSNIEYGWNNCIDVEAFANMQSPPTTGHQPRPSFQGSIRGSLDHHGAFRARLPGDKAVIADWSPPPQSMFASPLTEADQFKALESYVANIEGELQKHNELRGPMLLAFTPRHPNYNKAMNNWERKSSYLLKEIVKFRTYIDALSAAAVAKEKILKEKEQRTMELNALRPEVNERSHETVTPPDTLVGVQS